MRGLMFRTGLPVGFCDSCFDLRGFSGTLRAMPGKSVDLALAGCKAIVRVGAEPGIILPVNPAAAMDRLC
jgi:hypothetical protein